MNQQQTEQLAEAFKLQTQARRWFADLAASGVSEAAAMSAMQSAIMETIIGNHGKPAAERWLLGHLGLLDKMGDAMERELRTPGA